MPSVRGRSSDHESATLLQRGIAVMVGQER
jgi:hypothetical protein